MDKNILGLIIVISILLFFVIICWLTINRKKNKIRNPIYNKSLLTQFKGRAKCDICSQPIRDGEGYMLTTRDVVTSSDYWEIAFKALRLAGMLSEKEKNMPQWLIQRQCSLNTGWLTCDICIKKFINVNHIKAREYALIYWNKGGEGTYCPLNGGTVLTEKAIPAALNAWNKLISMDIQNNNKTNNHDSELFPICSICGKNIPKTETTIGENVRNAGGIFIGNDWITYMGTLCISCNKMYCLKCLDIRLKCPKCGSGVEVLIEDDLKKISVKKLSVNKEKKEAQ